MPWVRFDDDFPINRKVAGLSDAAYRLHSSAIFWCARNLTDGFLPKDDLDDVCARVRTPKRFAAECVRRDVWHPAGRDCPSENCIAPVDKDGWVIHDYLDFQPSKEQVLRDRLAARIRQERWKAKRNGPHNAVRDGVGNGVTNATPPRPAPKGSGAGTAPERDGGRAGPAGPATRAEWPLWCGDCDEITRHINPDEPSRCMTCHPLKDEPA
jgi:hypothetical protein